MNWNGLTLPDKPYYSDDAVLIYHADCRGVSLSGISAVVTDPPYELGFMGKAWDSKGVSFQKETWEHLRGCCLSGSPLLSFGGTRTFHRIACAIEDAGFEIRDCIMWVYGSGFPKSLNIGKAVDKRGGRHTEYTEFAKYIKAKRKEKGLTLKQLNDFFGFVAGCSWWEAENNNNFRVPNNEDYPKLKKLLGLDDRFDYLMGAVGEIIGESIRGNAGFSSDQVPRPWKAKIGQLYDITALATPEAQLWNGYGTGLKPAYEPIVLAMKPLDGTFAENCLKWGVGGLNIDGCRIGTQTETHKGRSNIEDNRIGAIKGYIQGVETQTHNYGRFPANFIHDGSQEVMELFPETKNAWRPNRNRSKKVTPGCFGGDILGETYNDNGSAARFFYCAKASRKERNMGCEDLPLLNNMRVNAPRDNETEKNSTIYHNNHPTVKPLALMEYLVKLVKMPEYNLILDPFMGSGTTLLACIRLGIPCIGIDNEEHTCEIAAKRCSQMVLPLETRDGAPEPEFYQFLLDGKTK